MGPEQMVRVKNIIRHLDPDGLPDIDCLGGITVLVVYAHASEPRNMVTGGRIRVQPSLFGVGAKAGR
jgi:hypothetical protein